MDNYAVIDKITNIVIAVVVWDGVSEWSPGEGYLLVKSDTAAIKDIWDGENFIRPPPTVEA